MVYPRIREPTLYSWQLNETHSRYDYPHAWPSEELLYVEFIILACVNAVVAFTVFLLIVALFRSKKVQQNPLNSYLRYIAIPDFLAGLLCAVTCAWSASLSHYSSEWMCGFQSFYLNFAFIANSWLNLVIVYQIHRLLQNSNIRRRYQPPTHHRVMLHAAVVYGYALLWAFLGGFNVPHLPHSTHLYYGFACMPMEIDGKSTLFFWLVFIPFSLGIPILYAAYVVIDILRRKLLPPTGRRRKLSLFLLRLCFLYFAVWLPFLFLFLIGNFVIFPQSIFWIGAVLSHLQGLLSALFCLTNEDIRRAFWLVVTCQPAHRESLMSSASEEEGSSSGGFSASFRISKSLRDSFGRQVSRRFTFTTPTPPSSEKPRSSFISQSANARRADEEGGLFETGHDNNRLGDAEGNEGFVVEEMTERAGNLCDGEDEEDVESPPIGVLPMGLLDDFIQNSTQDEPQRAAAEPTTRQATGCDAEEEKVEER